MVIQMENNNVSMTIRLPKLLKENMEALVREGKYQSKGDLIRTAVRKIIEQEKEGEVA